MIFDISTSSFTCTARIKFTKCRMKTRFYCFSGRKCETQEGLTLDKSNKATYGSTLKNQMHIEIMWVLKVQNIVNQLMKIWQYIVSSKTKHTYIYTHIRGE